MLNMGELFFFSFFSFSELVEAKLLVGIQLETVHTQNNNEVNLQRERFA